MSRFLKGIVNITLLCAILVSAALLVPPLAGVTTAVIDEERIETNLPKGSVTYALTKDLSEISKGDSLLMEKGDSVYAYKVEAVDGASGIFTLKDSLSAKGDTQEVTLRNTAEKIVITIPFIGYVAMAMKTTEGLIVIGLGVVFVIILFILAEIWKSEDDDDEYEADGEEESYGDEDDDDDDDEEENLSRKERKAKKKAEKKAEKKRRKAERRGYADDDDDEPLFPKAEARREEHQESMEEFLKRVQPEQETVVEKQEEQPVAEPEAEEMQPEEFQKTQEIPQPEQPAAAKVNEEPEEVEETQPEEQEHTEVKEPVHLAIPVYTADELIQKAKDAGEEPEIIEDEEAGVTILDYSDIL